MKIDLSEADYGDDLEWQIIAEPGDTVSWKKARPLDEVPLPRDQSVMVKPGTFISAMWLDEKDVERYEFAYVVAIREVAHIEDPGEPVLLGVSWLQSIKSTKEGIRPWMKKLDLDRSSMILSTDFDIIELECVADIVTDEIDVNGTVFTYPLAESGQVDGLAIALNCRRWFGRLSNSASRIHNGKVRVETVPKEAAESPSPVRKRKAKESLAEPVTSPKKSRVSPDTDEPTDTGSPQKPVPRGRTMVLDSTTVTRRRKSPVASEQSSKGPAMARRSKVRPRPTTFQEEDNVETSANAPDSAGQLEASTLESAPAANEKKTDPDAMELDNPETVNETDAERTKKSQTRAQSADASTKRSEVARATRASSTIPKSGLKVTFVVVDKGRTDEDILAPIAAGEEANPTTLAPEADVFMGYHTTDGVVDDDGSDIARLATAHAPRLQAQVALSLPEVATPERAQGDLAKHDTRTMLQVPASPDELSKNPTPKVNKSAPVKPVTDGETIKVAPKPGTNAVTRPNVGKKVTTESTKSASKPAQKEFAVVTQKDTTKKDAVVEQAGPKKSTTKTTKAPMNSSSSATTFIDEQIVTTKPRKKTAAPKKTNDKTAAAVDSSTDDKALVKTVSRVEKPTTKAVTAEDKPADEKVPTNDPAATKKLLTKSEAAKVFAPAGKTTKNKTTISDKTDTTKQTSATKPAEKKTSAKKTNVSQETDAKKQISTTKPTDEKTTAMKTTVLKKDTGRSPAAAEPDEAHRDSPMMQETAERKSLETPPVIEMEEDEDEAIAEMERKLAAMKAKRKSKA